jgi:type I restriction enzyme S subunit
MPQTDTIPTGWKETTLGEVANVMSGGTPSTEVEDYWNGDIPWITPKDLSDFRGVYITRGERNITNLGVKDSSACLLPTNTVLFTSRAPIGYTAIAATPLTTNQGFKNIVCDEKRTHYKFIYYWVRYSKNYVEKISSGSTFSEASGSVMKSLKITLPPLPEQREIAAVLSSLDDKIELLRAQNKTLEGMAQTLFKEWFVKFDFPDVNGRPYRSAGGKMVESELGEIPDGWRVDSFASTIDILGGGTPKTDTPEYWDGGVPWFSVVDSPSHTDVFVLKTEKTISKEGVDNSAAQILPEGTTIITARGTVGNLAIMGVPMTINQSCYGLRAKNIDAPYFTYYMTKRLLQKLKQSVHGSVFDTITKDTLAGVYLEISPPTIQGSFEKAVAPIINRIKANLSQVSTLSQARNALLPKLIKGYLRIKN